MRGALPRALLSLWKCCGRYGGRWVRDIQWCCDFRNGSCRITRLNWRLLRRNWSRLLAPLVDAGVDAFHCSSRRFWDAEFAGSNLNLGGVD